MFVYEKNNINKMREKRKKGENMFTLKAKK